MNDILPVLVRSGFREEADTITDFQLAMALETENLVLDKAVTLAGVNAVFADPSKGTYYTAHHEGKIIASLLITPEWSDWRNRTVLWIQSVYVLPDYRDQGIFKKMYEYIVDLVRKDKQVGGLRLYVDNSNTRAQEVYSRLGMNGSHYRVFEWMKEE